MYTAPASSAWGRTMSIAEDESEIDYENPTYIPSVEEYADFLKSDAVTDLERDILLVQWAAPDHCARHMVIGDALGRKLLIINGAYGRLGSKVIERFSLRLPDRAQVSHALSWFEHHEDGFYYSTMHKPLVKALELIGWGEEARRRFGQFWENHQARNPSFWEGRQREAALIQRSRNGQARRLCIEHYGVTCFVCDFDFEETYGELGAGFIEVHHLDPIGSTTEEYEIDPIEDLRPVCSNCHRILHRDGLMDIEELRTRLRQG
ncbi:MAG: HNH endonuclease [Proteobacteria bacterium]|nr:HNH endonuclease [Pseudomonadota bacterium]